MEKHMYPEYVFPHASTLFLLAQNIWAFPKTNLIRTFIPRTKPSRLVNCTWPIWSKFYHGEREKDNDKFQSPEERIILSFSFRQHVASQEIS